jgi:hypothetical protein
MQNDFKKNENGKLPQKCFKWKTTSKNLKMEDDFKKIVMGDDLNFFKMKDDLKKILKGK